MTPHRGLKFSFFTFFYSSTFTLLFLLLLALLLLTPGDLIAQSQRLSRLSNVFTIAGAYILIFIGSCIIYFTRLYATRRSVAALPHFPLSLPKSCRGMVKRNLSRSAAVAIAALPVGGEVEHGGWDAPGGELGGVEFVEVVEGMGKVLGADEEVRGGETLRVWMEEKAVESFIPWEEVEEFLELYEQARFRRRGKGVGRGEFLALVAAFEKIYWRVAVDRGGGESGDGGWDERSWMSEGYETGATVERVETEENGMVVPVMTSGSRGWEADVSGISAGMRSSFESSQRGGSMRSLGLHRRISSRHYSDSASIR